MCFEGVVYVFFWGVGRVVRRLGIDYVEVVVDFEFGYWMVVLVI